MITDPGTGLSIAGWGGNCPPYSVTGDAEKCDGGAAPSGFQIARVAKADDYQFTDKEISPGDLGPPEADLCGHTDLGVQNKPQASCDCDGKTPAHYTVHIEIGVLVSNKWYNKFITNAADIAFVKAHEDGHVAIARDFFDKAKDEAFKINDNSYETKAACDVTLETYKNAYAKLVAAYHKKQGGFDNEDESRNCHRLMIKYYGAHSPLPQAIALSGGPESDFGSIDLSQEWTLTVNGQSVVTPTLRSFRIRNITAADRFWPGGPRTPPDFLSDDFLRVVGSSTFNGVTLYAFSQPFQIGRGRVAAIEDVTVTEFPPPLPESIQAVAENPTLTALGQTTQIHVTATLHDGSTDDVTPRSHWTGYRTSNPLIAMVGGDGLVTARGSGSALITVVNEGATSVCQIDVSPGDPLTTVRGLVQDGSGTPVAGVTVNLIGLGALPVNTVGDGSFVISNVPTFLGRFRAAVRLLTTPPLFGVSADLDPVASGITDAGIITVKEGLTWIGQVSGPWHGASNWISGQVPGPTNDVFISAPPGVTITISQGSNVVNSILVNTPLRITGGSLRAANLIQANVPITPAGGTIVRSGLIAGSSQAVIIAT